MNKWFYPHIPPAWISNPFARQAAGKTFKYISEIIPADWITDHPDKVLWKDDRISYSINSYGYREEEYSEHYENLILGFGHSTVAGNAVANEDIFLRQIESSLPNTKALNFGIAGCSSDTVARIASCTIPYFITKCKKLTVCVLWPQDVRREIMLDNFQMSWQPTMTSPFEQFPLLIDETSNKYNLEKNKTMLDVICRAYDASLYTVPYKLYQKALDMPRARNNIDPSAEAHKMFATFILNEIAQETQIQS